MLNYIIFIATEIHRFVIRNPTKMNLKNFDKIVSKNLLEKGNEYIKNEAVFDLERLENGRWYAIVEGEEDYNIDINFDEDGECIEYNCTCPDDEDLCKHIVAVLLAIKGN